MNAIVAKQCLWCIEEDFESILLLTECLSFNVYKMYITAIFTHFVLKLYKNKNLRYSFEKATVDTADKAKLYLQHARVIRKDFCDGPEIKLTLPLGGIKQAGVPQTAAKIVAA